MEIFETHAHYDDDAFDGDRDELISRLPSFGIKKVCNIGADMKSSENTVQLTKKYDFFYGAVGVHPSDCEDMTEADIETLRKMAMDNEKIVGYLASLPARKELYDAILNGALMQLLSPVM